jgi:hypothetical protein
MEGRGFLEGVQISHPVQGAVIRGISDLLSGKSAADKSGSQERAADAASAVTFEILANFVTSPTRGRRPWSLVLYALSAFLLTYWSLIGLEAFRKSNDVFSHPGALRDQLAYRILSYDPEQELLDRLESSSALGHAYKICPSLRAAALVFEEHPTSAIGAVNDLGKQVTDVLAFSPTSNFAPTQSRSLRCVKKIGFNY